MTFSTLGLSPKVLAAVEASGYTVPTPIQAEAIPHVLQRRDVLGIAQTGTGKTAGFVLPMITLLEQGRARARMPRTLILEPTRELAAQVEENFNKYGQNHKLNVALLIGGVSFGDQEKKLDRGVDVLIATPGRLLDHCERGKLLTSGVEILVIDEADRMLDMGFIPDIERIVKLLPFTRQTLFFSATMPPEIQHLADLFLSNPVRIEVAKPATTAKTVTQLFVHTGRESADKRVVLRELIRGATDLKNAIIFCNRKREVAVLARSLEKHGFSVGALHGDMDQRARMATLDAFKNNRLTLLVASDVAARGLDIPDVSHVYNFDIPTHADDYVHRIGRTGRAGRSGTSITLVAPADQKYLSAIDKLTGDGVKWLEVASGGASAPQAEEAEPTERKRGSRRRSSSERGAAPAAEVREAAPEALEPAPKPVAKVPVQDRKPEGPVTAGRPETRPRTERPERPAGRQSRHDRHERDDEPVIGLGDHVPQFLLRPVRAPSS
ncbi:DEAD/DEAH box helicase [Kaistia algarum]|uniref:DEAD/DEAH box helicase n=1 Tax=Kaistia algarum TaxID=2083279 RepID=UPI000CE8FA88|nr:DEAD/DEAH box helicase [Kaistia algarum]MCX5515178.1 DEAD/DEAH box helicase [Kaistia algarum]PPE79897.1 DEAD/DEAH box helicase [Kaistia algarum]